MFKPRHTTTASSRSLPTESPALELLECELRMILGGQSQPDPGQELSDQFVTTVKTVMDTIDPVIAPFREGINLLVAAGNYARWAAEYQESREISEERGKQLDAEQREAEEQKQREQEQESDRLLRGDHETSEQEVQDYLDVIATEPPYSGQSPYIPSNMTDAELPPHTPRIILEPIDYTPTHHPG
jgi:hypothetical protein